MHVSLLLFDQVDLLDVGGPYEVFLTANRLAVREGRVAPFEVDTVSLDGAPVSSHGGMGLVPTASADVLDSTDLLVVPGAIALDDVRADAALIEAVRRAGRREGVTTTSVCTGAFLLHDAGLLVGRPWTTHWEDVDLLADEASEDGARRGVRWVDDGAVVTGGALSSGIAMALHLVERFAGRQLAERTARQMDHVWTETSEVTA